MTLKQTIRVLLIDDHAVVLAGLRLMLSTEAGIEVAGQAEHAEAALALLARERFDVALLDINLDGASGLDLLKHLRTQYPGMAVLMLSIYPEDMYAVRALRLGAAGYLNKGMRIETLVEAVRKVGAGGKYVSERTMEKLTGLFGSGAGGLESLSERELEVLRLIAAGESLVHIGERLQVTTSTVSTYRSRILHKLGMKRTADLRRYAHEHGLNG